jgi:hypothetical protein
MKDSESVTGSMAPCQQNKKEDGAHMEVARRLQFHVACESIYSGLHNIDLHISISSNFAVNISHRSTTDLADTLAECKLVPLSLGIGTNTSSRVNAMVRTTLYLVGFI